MEAGRAAGRVRGKSVVESRKGKGSEGMEKALDVLLLESAPMNGGQQGIGGAARALAPQTAVQGQTRGRGLVPPALPVPIASFTI